MSTHAVYKIVCLENGKIYIGQSKNWRKRWNEHKRDLNCGCHHSLRLQRAWNKYGEEKFEHSIIEFCEYANVDEREIYWINHYESTNKLKGFNNESGGCANKSLSEETKKRLSLIHSKRYHIAVKYLNSPEALEKKRQAVSGERNPMYGKKFSEEIRLKMSLAHKGKQKGPLNPMFGKPISEERRALYSEIFSGSGNPFYSKKHSDSAKEKIRAAATGRKASDAARAKMSSKRQGKDNPAARSVICITTGAVFDTANEAASFYGVHPNGVRMCCRGERKRAGKMNDGTFLEWKYVD